MLKVEAINIFTDAQNVADYSVKVMINTKTIFQGTLEGHDRELGAGELLRSIGDMLEKAEGWASLGQPTLGEALCGGCGHPHGRGACNFTEVDEDFVAIDPCPCKWREDL